MNVHFLKKTLPWGLLLLGTGGVVLAYFLVLDFYGVQSTLTTTLCGGDSTSSCQKVSASAYATVPLGFVQIPVAVVGLVFYGVLWGMLAIALHEPLRFRVYVVVLAWLIVGAVVNLVLLGISVGILQVVCNLCLTNYILEAVMLALVGVGLKLKWFGAVDYKPLKKHKIEIALAIALGSVALGFAGLLIGDRLKAQSKMKMQETQSIKQEAQGLIQDLYQSGHGLDVLK